MNSRGVTTKGTFEFLQNSSFLGYRVSLWDSRKGSHQIGWRRRTPLEIPDYQLETKIQVWVRTLKEGGVDEECLPTLPHSEWWNRDLFEWISYFVSFYVEIREIRSGWAFVMSHMREQEGGGARWSQNFKCWFREGSSTRLHGNKL